jgi:hypothetical protein
MADDDPGVILHQVEHPLLSQAMGQLVEWVSRDLSQGGAYVPLSEGHTHPSQPRVMAERLEDLAFDAIDALRLDSLWASGKVEYEAGLSAVGARRLRSLCDPFDPLKGKFLREDRLLTGHVAKACSTSLLIGRSEEVTIVGGAAPDLVRLVARRPEPTWLAGVGWLARLLRRIRMCW